MTSVICVVSLQDFYNPRNLLECNNMHVVETMHGATKMKTHMRCRLIVFLIFTVDRMRFRNSEWRQTSSPYKIADC